MVVDGVFAEDGRGRLRFHAGQPPTEAELDQVLTTIVRRVRRLLVRRGVCDDDAGDPRAEADPVLAGLTGASRENSPLTDPCQR